MGIPAAFWCHTNDPHAGRTYLTREVEGPALKIKKLAAEITGEHPDWTDARLREEVKRRLKCEPDARKE